MANRLVPELSVSDWKQSMASYCDVLGFTVRFTRPEEGFCYLEREGAEVMLDQIGLGRDFHDPATLAHPFGRALNLQIEVSDAQALLRFFEDLGTRPISNREVKDGTF